MYLIVIDRGRDLPLSAKMPATAVAVCHEGSGKTWILISHPQESAHKKLLYSINGAGLLVPIMIVILLRQLGYVMSNLT